MKYFYAEDVRLLAESIIEVLGLSYIDRSRLGFVRSFGSRSRRVAARIHALGRVWEAGFDIKPRYLIEVLSERYDRLSQQEKEKVIIHELLHIPRSFGGGFIPHGRGVNQMRVEELHTTYRVKRSAKPPYILP